MMVIKKNKMNKIKFLTILFIAALFLVSCFDETFEFELPEEGSIVDVNPPNPLFAVAQSTEDWKTITVSNLSTESLYYEWDLGDGTFKTTDSPWFTHTYDTNDSANYTISLLASDDSGNSKTYEYELELNKILSASFEVEQSNANISGNWQEISLINTSVSADSYFWDFGDGNSSTNKEPNYTYITDEEQTYIITLTVKDVDGNEEVTSNTFTLVKPKDYLLPEVVEGDFELGESETGGIDSRTYWGKEGLLRKEPAIIDMVETSTLQISSNAISGNYSAKLPDDDSRLGYQELELTENINYRITYNYRFKAANSEGVLRMAIVKELTSFDDIETNTIESIIYEASSDDVVSSSLEFNSGDNTTLAIIFYNESAEVNVDDIVLEGLD